MRLSRDPWSLLWSNWQAICSPWRKNGTLFVFLCSIEGLNVTKATTYTHTTLALVRNVVPILPSILLDFVLIKMVSSSSSLDVSFFFLTPSPSLSLFLPFSLSSLEERSHGAGQQNQGIFTAATRITSNVPNEDSRADAGPISTKRAPARTCAVFLICDRRVLRGNPRWSVLFYPRLGFSFGHSLRTFVEDSGRRSWTFQLIVVCGWLCRAWLLNGPISKWIVIGEDEWQVKPGIRRKDGWTMLRYGEFQNIYLKTRTISIKL